MSDETQPEPGARRVCAAINKAGNRCSRPPRVGTDLCDVHNPAMKTYIKAQNKIAAQVSHAATPKQRAKRRRRMSQAVGGEKALVAMIREAKTADAIDEARRSLAIAILVGEISEKTGEVLGRLLDSSNKFAHPESAAPRREVGITWLPTQAPPEPAPSARPPMTPVVWTGPADLSRPALPESTTEYLAPLASSERPLDLGSLAVGHGGPCLGARCVCNTFRDGGAER